MIEVRPIRRRGRKYFQAEWRDPASGLVRSKSTKCTKKKDADRFCANLERDLRSGVQLNGLGIGWDEFRKRHEAEVQAALATKTGDKYRAIFNHVEAVIRPKKLASVDAAAISRLQQHLRSESHREITIRTSLSYLSASLSWAADLGMIPVAPKLKLPKRVATSKGRAITAEEFDRMLDAVPSVVGVSRRFKNNDARRDARIEAWKHLLRGLWWSGLRLSEALDLHWKSDRRMRVDFSGKRPMLIIRPEGEKAFRDRLYPMAPEFATLLDATAQNDRKGFVFDPMTEIDYGRRMRMDSASKVIEKIGKAANIRVSADGKSREKFASAHDLRRAFGFRWAMRVAPAALKELMRHENITTTMQFYVGHEAEAVADVIWRAADTYADTCQISASSTSRSA